MPSHIAPVPDRRGLDERVASCTLNIQLKAGNMYQRLSLICRPRLHIISTIRLPRKELAVDPM
ncbi:hypothetical protein PILCRDRAFT_822366 [Piloderma croceum F 1598]|uniref:Uncharacterized protein n=1 Tax=Piloderma croceum (strain F 1598) TaxID=765440 RepID=A0A0C3F7M6_PILCF|nr:hypothetical protein PILCRDRAFT_822366 [Piloderma croceum F 1598]